jgi:hypothetical protein
MRQKHKLCVDLFRTKAKHLGAESEHWTRIRLCTRREVEYDIAVTVIVHRVMQTRQREVEVSITILALEPNDVAVSNNCHGQLTPELSRAAKRRRLE